jgi:hypothetical protein
LIGPASFEPIIVPHKSPRSAAVRGREKFRNSTKFLLTVPISGGAQRPAARKKGKLFERELDRRDSLAE